MTTETRHFRVILDTCDIVNSPTEREEWPESKAPQHSIFDQRRLSTHKPLDANGRIKKPRVRAAVPAKPVKHRTPAPTESCSVCNGCGYVEKLIGELIVCSIQCKRCGGTGEQFKFITIPPKPAKPPKPPKPKPTKPSKVYSYRTLQQHMSHGDPCTLCNQSAAEHRPNRHVVKKEREGNGGNR